LKHLERRETMLDLCEKLMSLGNNGLLADR